VGSLGWERATLAGGAGAFAPRSGRIRHIPQVEGENDGIPRKFDIDTGSRGALSLLRPFWEKHDLKARLGAGIEAVTGWGVGGWARGLLARADVLRLGGVTIERPVTGLSLQTKGAFTDPCVAGNVGAEILKRFNVTFDYARQEITFEPNATHAAPHVYDRSGLWLKQAAGSFEVLDVIPGSPAAGAGIKVGDRVLEIDGREAGELPLPEARQKLRTPPPGTKVRLTVRSGDRNRRVVLTLKDLLCRRRPARAAFPLGAAPVGKRREGATSSAPR
jgi:hypothetical protein